MTAENKYRISGHESFPCRYTWLPKAVQGLSREPKLFADEQKAMVDLGLGKNMVRSVRFWAQKEDAEFHLSHSRGYAPPGSELQSACVGEIGKDFWLDE
ncbi:MAG: DUF4007 family protein [Verrucomicrobia bacterium]|nr:DUF4007 family protein [Verrucomicrobiota bacterium]